MDFSIWYLQENVASSDKKAVLYLFVDNYNDIVYAQNLIKKFYKEEKESNYLRLKVSLCIEEISKNILDYGKKIKFLKPIVNIKIVNNENEKYLQFMDNCKIFDPCEYYNLNNNEQEKYGELGIKLVLNISRNVKYHQVFRMNVLTVYF